MPRFDIAHHSVLLEQNKTLARAFSSLADTVKTVLPHTAGELNVLVNNVEQTFTALERRLDTQILMGNGPRAQVLKYLADFYPEKEFGRIVSESLPKYVTEEEDLYNKAWAFRKKIDALLDEAVNMTRYTKLQWIPSRRDLVHTHVAYRLLEEPWRAEHRIYSGLPHSYDISSDKMTLVYPHQGADGFKKVLFVPNTGEMVLCIYIPLEDRWVRTSDLRYTDLDKAAAEIASYLETVCPCNSITLAELIDEAVVFCEENVPRCDPKELLTLPHYATPWETKYDEKTPIVRYVNEDDGATNFKVIQCRYGSMTFSLRRYIADANAQPVDTFSSDFSLADTTSAQSKVVFDDLPVRLRRQIAYWFMECLSKSVKATKESQSD